MLSSRHKAYAVALAVVVLGAAASTGVLDRAPPVTGVYGAALAVDSKNNHQVGWTVGQRVAYRFRAGTTSELVSIALNQRGGPGYSGGTGGRLLVVIREDEGGFPSGTGVASLEITPGNPSGHWENHATYRFPSPAALKSEESYHVVFSNVDPSPATNYISLNAAYQYLPTTPRQPSFTDDFAVLQDRGSGWELLPNDTPVLDLGYADGHHDGQAYAGVVADYATIVTGPHMARERFTVSGPDRKVTSAAVRVKRIRGDAPLEIRLETQGGTVLAAGTAVATHVPPSALPTPVDGNSWDEASLAGGRWVDVSFPSVVLESGRTYTLRISTEEGTTYAVVPIREVDDADPAWGAFAFRDGLAERTSDGTTWAEVYAHGRLDLQFYLR